MSRTADREQAAARTEETSHSANMWQPASERLQVGRVCLKQCARERACRNTCVYVCVAFTVDGAAGK